MSKDNKDNGRRLAALKLFTTISRASDSFHAAVFSGDPLEGQLTITEFAVLEALLHKGSLHQCEVAERILKSRGNISVTVQQLVEKGYVKREADTRDRRHTVITLTSTGRDIVNRTFARVSDNIQKACRCLDDEELAAYIRLNKKLGKGAFK